jgi:hypothetical protein
MIRKTIPEANGGLRFWAVALSCLLALLCAAGETRAFAVSANVAFADWSAKASPNLAEKPPPQSDIENFLNALQISLGGEAEYEKNGNGNGVICSFGFADLRGNGYLSLVVGTGVSDRPYCRDVNIIDEASAGFELYFLEGDPDFGRDVTSKLKDLNHDGKDEFLLTNTFGEIKGQCVAHWTAIFAWTGSNYTNVSNDNFIEFYRGQLASLDKRIAALHPIQVYGGGFVEPEDKDCLIAEAAKVRRHLGISPDAGFDQAVHLAGSEDAAKRRFAAELFGDIGTAQARKYLETLDKDPEPGVRKTAKSYLSALSRGPVSVAPDCFIHPQGPESLSNSL